MKNIPGSFSKKKKKLNPPQKKKVKAAVDEENKDRLTHEEEMRSRSHQTA